jgi:hypothetical protein
VELGVDTFHVGEVDFLAENHFVKGSDEEGVKEAAMEDGETDHAANEFKVAEMFGVDARVRVNLQGVVVVGGVFEETVEGVEHFVGEEEEELSAMGSVVLMEYIGDVSYLDKPP